MESRQWEKLWCMVSYRKVMARASWSSSEFLREVILFSSIHFISWHVNTVSKPQHSSESPIQTQVMWHANNHGRHTRESNTGAQEAGNVLLRGAAPEHCLLEWKCEFSDSTLYNSRRCKQFNTTTAADMLWFVLIPSLQLVSHWNPTNLVNSYSFSLFFCPLPTFAIFPHLKRLWGWVGSKRICTIKCGVMTPEQPME